jgi:hypothetical protein
MNKANRERLEMLLKGHEEMLEEKRMRPEGILRKNDSFREEFNRMARAVILPTLEEIKDVMVGKVESASIFHRSTAAGLKVKLDRWEDYDRSLLFYGDDSTKVVKVTYEGVGFGLLASKLPLAQLDVEAVEEEAMKFLRRLFGEEQLRRPSSAAGQASNVPGNGPRQPVGARQSGLAGFEFLRV